MRRSPGYGHAPPDAPLPLDPSPDRMRARGYRVIDMIVEHRRTLSAQPVHRQRSMAELRAALPDALTREGRDLDALLDLVRDHVLAQVSRTDHPRFMGYVPSPGSFEATLGDALSAGFNVFCGHWLVGSGAGAVEAMTIGWLRDLMGFPATTVGLFLSGGSMANLAALHVARAQRREATEGHRPTFCVYVSSEAHASVDKALAILGFALPQVRRVAIDAGHRMRVDDLDAQIAADRAADLEPMAVVASAGSTSVGAVDPLIDLRQICDREGLWLHVDGAFGAVARLCPDQAEQLPQGARIVKATSRPSSTFLSMAHS